MEFLTALALKSLLIASGTLLLLKLMQRRSASDRSWIAHLGLAAILLLPVGAVVLPALEVVGPAFLSPAATAPAASVAGPSTPAANVSAGNVTAPEVAASASPFPASQSLPGADIDWALWAYALPAGLLILLTLIALGRLGVLKSRANVLVDTHWLKALAKAQRRMGFKNGTALLTSDELGSPISWGLMRPVILLNTDATRAKAEAEAIIAHELAHVARLDWAKLMLARVAVALFWFNPLVWLLSREAHQLREEAADDAVLAANIEDTEYANLLVGIARHECRGLLLGAHGVAPARNSLSRRVKRVLNAALERAPGGWRWSSAAAIFAAGMAVPVAALQVINPTIAEESAQGRFVRSGVASAAPVAPADAIMPVTATASATAVRVSDKPLPLDGSGLVSMAQPDGATITSHNGRTVLTQPNGGTITVYPRDANGQRKTVMTAANGSVMTYSDVRAVPGLAAASAVAVSVHGRGDAIDRAIELKAVGASPEYVAAMRRAAPHLRLDHDDIIQLKAVGIGPDYVRDLGNAGYVRLTADDMVQAKAMGINGAYVRGMAQAGYGRLSMDELVEMKAVGVTPDDVMRFRRANRGLPSVDKMVQIKSLGLRPEDIPPDDD